MKPLHACREGAWPASSDDTQALRRVQVRHGISYISGSDMLGLWCLQVESYGNTHESKMFPGIYVNKLRYED